MKDIDLLSLFVQRTQELANCRMMRDGINAGFSIKWSLTGQLSFTPKHSDEDDFRSVLVCFRRFISESEPLHIFRVMNIFERRIQHEELRNQMRNLRLQWREKQVGAGISWKVNEQVIAPEYLADLMINGRIFHDDPEKIRRADELGIPSDPLVTAFSNSIFRAYIFQSAAIMITAGQLVEKALRTNQIDAG